MKLFIIFILSIALHSCRTTRIDVSEREYSTGYMGMPGEITFVFKNGNQFYYYERLYYSEGTFVWVDKSKIKLTSKIKGFEIPYKEAKWFQNISNKEITLKANKLLFEGFTLKRVNVKRLK
ncbi:hypothetical protein [Pedobacter heparinus]|uniref:hypothetical protein n=1 Tax=Pedobacter heparinus TaxID=984 RepID=UPI00292FA04F|nr:hypothetical protein [Pedobacter heparinus]